VPRKETTSQDMLSYSNATVPNMSILQWTSVVPNTPWKFTSKCIWIEFTGDLAVR